jgi:SOS-response transcriptional repressor LexA
MASVKRCFSSQDASSFRAKVARTKSRSVKIVSRSEQLTRKSSRILSQSFRALKVAQMRLIHVTNPFQDGVPRIPVPIPRRIGGPNYSNSRSIEYLRVEGESMMPLIHDGYIVALDTSKTDARVLAGSIVVASHPDTGLVVSRLRPLQDQSWLVPENPEYKLVAMHGDCRWVIRGKVIWWMGQSA